MNVNIYKYRSIQEKMLADGKAMAQAKMQADENKLKYFGDKLVAKIKRHNGENMYLLREEVVEEILKYIIYINEAAEYVYDHECLNRHNKAHMIEKSFMYYVANVKPNQKHLDSLAKCYTGTPMMSFYRDTQAIEEQKAFDEERRKLSDEWCY